MSSAKTDAQTITTDLVSGLVKIRDRALDDLNQLLSPNNVFVDLSSLTDTTYHDIFEALFKTVLEHKPKYFDRKTSTSKAAEARLSKCAKAVRAAASRGAAKLKQKTLIAVVDHITQVLPGPTEGFVQPLLNNYVKALTEVLGRCATAEFFARKDGKLWQLCADFFLDIISYRIPQNGAVEQGLVSRNSLAPSTPRSTLRSNNSGSLLSQKLPETKDGEPVRDALEGLYRLVSAGNAQILSRYQEIANEVLVVLRLHNLSLGSLQTMSFAIINRIISATQLDDPTYTSILVKDLLPLMAHWWRADKAAQDATMQSLRNEILKTILVSQLHIEHLAVNKWEERVRDDVQYLLEPLWQEYSKRAPSHQLQLSDITFATDKLPSDHLHISIFGLREFKTESESQWAIVQCLASLEAVLIRPKPKSPASQKSEQPRKRRRVDQADNRLHARLNGHNMEITRTALQAIPFILATGALNAEQVQNLLSELAPFTTHKDTSIASWALIACSSCLLLSDATTAMVDDWKQLWQVATRAVSLQSTCRAACLLIHNLMETEILPHHSLTDDINIIITTADVNGPAALCDTSVALMYHLLHVRNAILPSASQATSNHVIRWAFLRWNPAEISLASTQAVSVQPIHFVNLLRACSGMKPFIGNTQETITGGQFYETWKLQREIAPFHSYLLLLSHELTASPRRSCKYQPAAETPVSTSESNTHFPSRRLMLELCYPKMEELSELCTSWSKKPNEGGSQISQEKFECLLSACIIGAMLLPELSYLTSSQAALLESLIMTNAERGITQALASVEANSFVHQILRNMRQCMPSLTQAGIERLHQDNEALLRLLTLSFNSLKNHNATQGSTGSYDMTNFVDEFASQSSRGVAATASTSLPRYIHQLHLNPTCFYTDTRRRLSFIAASKCDDHQIGLVPDDFIDELVGMSDKELLSCYLLLTEIFSSDLVTSPNGACAIIERLGEVVSNNEYRCCEVALTACIEVIHGLTSMWLSDMGDLATSVGDLYNYFIKISLTSNFFSPGGLKAFASLLFTLLKKEPGYGASLKLDSCRTSLLFILKEGSMSVKYFVAEQIADLFELYILMLHDEVFIDVLGSLPANPESEAGIACRLLVLSNLAQRWPTLLRRCTYHIFETPGKISSFSEHARRCIADISRSLKLASSKDLFALFARQLLYTWMENDRISDIPFSIFGFESLGELLTSAQSDAIALSTMRGQDSIRSEIAGYIGKSEVELLQTNFAASISYSTVYTAVFQPSSKENGESKMKKKLGNKLFTESIYTNFVDMVAIFFDLIDQEDAVEKVFARSEELAYALKIHTEITNISKSSAKLPPNQQPMFRAKYVIHELARLCHGTEFLFNELWTPALIVFIARKLFNTVHPALGSLHACSVLRKVRILICLAGAVALESYCLEMLLTSVQTFINDSECADDALGISQYLLDKGGVYLQQVPSFLAGYSLSTLASLRVFLESSQSSTTQESQFKATMSKAKKFHEWLSTYLDGYTSPSFKSESQHASFKSITSSAARIRSSGNAEQSTFESKLLLDILRDENAEHELLNEPSRELAMGLLCGDFTIPECVSNDIIGTDEKAVLYASSVWKSCDTKNLSANYLAWAGRVVGRAFAASGDIPAGIIAESNLAHYTKIAPGPNGSEMGLLHLIQRLTSNPNTLTAGLAETVLRAAISKTMIQEDEALLIACQRSLTEPLFLTSQWSLYRSPPAENKQSQPSKSEQSIWDSDMTSAEWLSDLCILMANSVPDSILLSVLSPVLEKVQGFAEKAFPFIVHLVLLFQLEQQQTMKRSISVALKTWLKPGFAESARAKVALLIDTLLYLRTQEYPKETSIGDRLHWLDIDYTMAAAAASNCGMYKTALLFAELASIETGRQSRHVSAARETDLNSTLLSVFENIDDPDAYYGLPEDASLSNVVARVTYENNGMKSLAFRGAQFDSHIRQRHDSTNADGQALVGALSTLGLSGLSHSLQQAQQTTGNSAACTENTFRAAQKLEMWNLPAPKDSDSFAVTTYKAYQAVHNATEATSVKAIVYEGFCQTIQRVTGVNKPAISMLRNQLGALAALSELDDLMHVAQSEDLSHNLDVFQSRGDWMRRGRYDDVSHILSCRGTALSMLSQHSNLLHEASLSTAVMRKAEVESLLLSSGLYRFHEATQESLNIATSLSNLVPACREMDLHVDAAINVEVANSLWDHGEMSTAIRMLQSIDKDSALSKQAIPVTKADLLAKIGDKVSIARLETPHDIQKKYLEPALKELGSTNYGQEAGLAFHQFALFCDGQLQDPDGLEDLARLQNLRKAKSDEVSGLRDLIASAKGSQLRKRYDHALSKERQWLELDEQELRRVEQTRSEFVRLSVENYLLSLIATDAHNNDALRFTALWLERSAEEGTNKAVSRYLSKVPTRNFASLMNQLTSRLQHTDSPFQKLLLELVYNICVDHPYHGMYQIWSGTKVRVQSKDEVAVQRVKATEKVAQRLAMTKSVSDIWLSIEKTSKYYHGLAMDKDTTKYKSGGKFPLKESQAGLNLVIGLAKYHIPPPTMHIEIRSNKDYSTVPTIAKLEPAMTIAGGVSAPKIITAICTDGKKYKQLVKGSHDDLRQDAIMEQVFAAVSSLLKLHRSAQQRSLGIRTYKVLPLTATSGLIEFVPNTIPLHEFLMPAHERYYPKDLRGSQCRKEIFNVQNRNIDTRISTYRKVTDRFHPVMKYFFMEYFEDPDEWYAKRLAYTRSTAAISMLGHVLGLGDRHGHNILLDTKTGEAIHIDLGVAFEAGRILPVPELVPFRLTRDIVDGMGISKTEGVFRRCCEFTLDALREEQYSIMTILDVLRYDPLYTWSISPLRLAKLQKARDEEDGNGAGDAEQSEAETRNGRKPATEAAKGKKHLNEPSEADRALEVVRKKLSKALSVTATVNDLINQATDERNLAMLYSGWAAYA